MPKFPANGSVKTIVLGGRSVNVGSPAGKASDTHLKSTPPLATGPKGLPDDHQSKTVRKILGIETRSRSYPTYDRVCLHRKLLGAACQKIERQAVTASRLEAGERDTTYHPRSANATRDVI